MEQHEPHTAKTSKKPRGQSNAEREHMQTAAKRYLKSADNLWKCVERAKYALMSNDESRDGLISYSVDGTPKNPNTDTDRLHKIVTRRERLTREYNEAVNAYFDRRDEISNILDLPDISRENALYLRLTYLSRGYGKRLLSRGRREQSIDDAYKAVYKNMPDGWR